MKFTLPPFGDSSTSRGFAFGNSFENALEGNYTQGQTFDGWTVDSNTVAVVYGSAAAGQMYANLVEAGSISQTLPTKKGRPYKLSFAYRGKPLVSRASEAGDTSWITQPQVGPVFSTGQIEGTDSLGSHTNAPNGTVDRHYRIINNPDPHFPPAPDRTVRHYGSRRQRAAVPDLVRRRHQFAMGGSHAAERYIIRSEHIPIALLS